MQRVARAGKTACIGNPRETLLAYPNPSRCRAHRPGKNGVLMRFLEAEHVVEAETARLVDHAMIPK